LATAAFVTRAQRAWQAALDAKSTVALLDAYESWLAKDTRARIDRARLGRQKAWRDYRLAVVRVGYEIDRERERSRRAPGAPDDPVWASVEEQVRAELSRPQEDS
jgi:hypothetical protein